MSCKDTFSGAAFENKDNPRFSGSQICCFFACLGGLGFSPKRVCDPSVSEFGTSAIHYVVKTQHCCLTTRHTTSKINDISQEVVHITFFYCFAGFCLRYRSILRLLFLLHHPTGSALPVLLCRPASRGENHLGKGRPSRTYRKFPRTDLVVFRKLSS